MEGSGEKGDSGMFYNFISITSCNTCSCLESQTQKLGTSETWDGLTMLPYGHHIVTILPIQKHSIGKQRNSI